MQTALDVPTQTLDESERNFVGKIREHGWYRTEILADDEGPGFSFTTGFWVSAGHPELMMFSVNGEIAHDMFWDLFREVKAGMPLPIGQRTDRVFASLPAYVFPVAKRFYADHLGWSHWFYRGDDFPCLQILWPDRRGIFPWEAGFDPALAKDQPDLTEHGWRVSIADH